MIAEVRAAGETTPHRTAAQRVAWHRELDGSLLDPQIAAVELLNVLRPTVAVAV